MLLKDLCCKIFILKKVSKRQTTKARKITQHENSYYMCSVTIPRVLMTFVMLLNLYVFNVLRLFTDFAGLY